MNTNDKVMMLVLVLIIIENTVTRIALQRDIERCIAAMKETIENLVYEDDEA